MKHTMVGDDLAVSIIDAQPEVVVWYKPILADSNDADSVLDFEVAYCNTAAADALQVPRDQIIGQRILSSPLVDESTRTHIYQQCRQTWEQGKELEFNYYNEYFGRYYNVIRSKVLNGVISITRDVTKQILAEKQLQHQAILLQSILDSSMNGIFACEAIRNDKGAITDLRFLQFNKMFLQLVNKTEDELNSKTYLAAFPSAHELFQLNCSVIESGRPLRTEVYYNGEGLDGWYEISLVKLGSNGLVVSFMEISERKKDKEAIIAAAQNLQNVIDSSQTGITVIVPEYNESGEIIDFRYKIVNQTFSSYIGKAPDELAGQLLTHMFPSYKAQGTFDRYKKIYNTGEPQRFDLHYVKDGYDVWVDILAKKLGNEILVTFHDYTPLKKAQLQLETMVKDLTRSNASLEDFAFAASHDLQEPLRKIHFFADRLKSNYAEKLDEPAVNMLDRMETASLRMRQLIDDLLVYSQINLKPKESDQVDLNEIMHDALTDLENVIHEKNARITTDMLPVVKGDRPQIRQLFVNILSNSLKYVHPEKTPFVSIRSKQVTGVDSGFSLPAERRNELYHLFEFTDNGIGFEQEDAEKIFNVFQRLHGKNEYTGTGVGLAIVKKVVDNHHGFVCATGKPNEGSCFSVLLPVAHS